MCTIINLWSFTCDFQKKIWYKCNIICSKFSADFYEQKWTCHFYFFPLSKAIFGFGFLSFHHYLSIIYFIDFCSNLDYFFSVCFRFTYLPPPFFPPGNKVKTFVIYLRWFFSFSVDITATNFPLSTVLYYTPYIHFNTS